MKKIEKILVVLGILVAVGPLLIAFLSLPVSLVLLCGGGNSGTCLIGGNVAAEFVETLALFHWFTIMTFIPGMIIAGVGIVVGKLIKIMKPK
jgi:hypothetical protein